MKRILVMIGLLVLISRLEAQNVGVGIADPTCRLDVLSANINTTVGRFMSGGGIGEIQIGNGTKSLYLGTNTSGAYIASTGGDPLFFRNGGSVKMTLVPAGLLGIGTETPGYRLDVQSPGTNSTVTRFKTAGGIADIIIENGTQQMKIGVNDSSAYVRTATGHDLRLQTGGQDRILIDYSTGFTGINTISPSYRLDIYGGISDSTIARFKTTSGVGEILVENQAQQLKLGVNATGGYVQTSAADDLRFRIGSQDRIFIDHISGFTGINTTTPAFRLDANAGISNATIARFKSAGGYGDILIENDEQQLMLGVNDTGGYVESSIGHDIVLKTDTLPRIIIKHGTGNVGIGTVNPGTRFYVLDGAATSSTIATFEGADNFERSISIGNAVQNMTAGVTASAGYLGTATPADLKIRTGSIDRMTVQHTSGFVGINTPSPEYRLDVQAPSQNLTVARFKTPSGYAAVQVDNGIQQLKFGVHNAGAFIQTFTPHDLYIQTNNQDRIVIDHETGNVGIGTSVPSKRLEVIGDIKLSGVIENEAMQSASLINGWVNYGDGFETAGYYKDKQGVVRLHGLVKSGTDSHILTLPLAYRPAKTHMFTIISGNGFARIDVHSNGNVVLVGTYSNAYVSLDGMAFRL